MTLQARAEATRQTIIDAATAVIDEFGFPGSSLTDVIERAGVTKGAFYYHFPTKDALGIALVEVADTVVEDAGRRFWKTSTGSALENFIRSAFAIASTAQHDNRVRVGFRVRQAMGQVGRQTVGGYDRQRESLVRVVRQAIAEGDFRQDVNPDEAGLTLWLALLGIQLHADANGEDITAALAAVMAVILPGLCAPETTAFFKHFTDRVAGRQAESPDHIPLADGYSKRT